MGSKKLVKAEQPKEEKNTKKRTVTPTNEIEKVKSPMAYMPFLFGFIALLLLLMLLLSESGVLGKVFSAFLKGCFGYGIFAVPAYLIVFAIFWKSDRAKNAFTGRLLLGILSFVFLLTLINMYTASPDQRDFDKVGSSFISAFYSNGKQGIGAGLLGGVFGGLIDFLVGDVITYVISYVVLFFSAIYLFSLTPKKVFRGIISWFKRISLTRRENDESNEEEAEKKQEKKPKQKEKSSKDESFNTSEKKKPEVIYDEDISEGSYSNAVDEPQQRADAKSIQKEQPKKEEISAFSENEYEADFKEAEGEPPLTYDNEYNDIQSAEAELSKGESDAEPAECDDVVTEDSEFQAEPVAPPYIFPPITLLASGSNDYIRQSSQNIALTGQKLISVLRTYGVKATLVSTSRGPAVTRYEVLPDEGVRVSRIEGLGNDIRMRLAASNVRIESNIPGKAAIGIEIPNENSTLVRLRDLIDTDIFRNEPSKLFVCLGVDVGGNPVYFDIPDMPHLLIAGATGMGKSVCINSILISLLYRARPDDVKFILIDPKKIELSDYNNIPHMLVPVVTDPAKAAGALSWAVNEMERRYTLMEQLGNARKLEEYNEMIEGDPERDRLPYIVIIIDELADLMMTAKDAVETSICRLAQKARAAGIYLILGTQRPSADVITGLIKANIPSRIAFTVSQSIDSRIILDENGAESLLGKGDMIYAPVKMMKKLRVQGAFVDGKSEVASVCAFVKGAAQVQYNDEAIQGIEELSKLCGEKPGKRKPEDMGSTAGEKEDCLFFDAIAVGFEYGTMSTSLLQRKLSIGYSRAQKMIDMMEDRGYVGKFDPTTKKRQINITPEELAQLRLNSGDSDE